MVEPLGHMTVSVNLSRRGTPNGHTESHRIQFFGVFRL